MNKFQEEMMTIALVYASRGWAILPTSKKNKTPLISGGSRSATTNPTLIRQWWRKHPNANIGLATGKISGFWVVDIDIKGGKDGLKAIMDEFGDNILSENQLIARTASGGYHIFFKCPDDFEIHNKQGVLSGVDIRGDGGYVIAAPSSMCINGDWVEYKWNKGGSKIMDAPKWAMNLAKRGGGETSVSGRLDVHKCVVGMTDGARDVGLFKFACLLRQRNIPRQLAEEFISQSALRCKPSFPIDVAMDKVDQAYSKYDVQTDTRSEELDREQMKVQAELQRIRKLLGEIK